MVKEVKTLYDSTSSLHDELVAESCDLHQPLVCTKYRKTNVVIRTEHKEAKDALPDAF